MGSARRQCVFRDWKTKRLSDWLIEPPLGQGITRGEDACHFRRVFGSPSAQWDDRLGQAATKRSQRVIHARRHLSVVLARQHAIGFQILQLLDQHLVADVRDQALELAIALWAAAQEKQDQRFPLARDDAKRGVEPAAGVADFRGRRHFTGGATGIGFAAAKRFIEEGAFVFIVGRRQEALDTAVAALGPNARAVKGSVSDEADLDRLYAAVKAERGTLDIVFANAGAGSPLPLGQITAEHIDETFDTNVKGTIFTVQKALPLMSAGGSIILTGSSAGTTGAPGFTAYSASKAAVRNLARTWAQDLKGTGIRVNVLSPGATATELAKEALGEEGQKAYGAMTPLLRMAEPAEIGAAAAFLASSDSSFMTASEVAVDGGLAQI